MSTIALDPVDRVAITVLIDNVTDPLILDDHALVLRLRDRGLVVLSGCGHVRYSRRLTGEDTVAAVIGGFDLSGPMTEPVIEPTVDAFADLAPGLLVPAHCTGWPRPTASPRGSPTRSR